MPTNRRSVLKKMGAALGASFFAGGLTNRLAAADQAMGYEVKGKIKHSVCKWCYRDISMEDLCKAAEGIGLSSVEIVGVEDWPTLQKYGLTCAMGNGVSLGIPKGWNDPQYHEELIKLAEEFIPLAAEYNVPNLIVFSGNRNGMDDETGMINCAKGLRKIMSLAEKHKVSIVMELLNSKVNHKDYMCDRTTWGAALVEMVGSDRFKLLYDIYHMQIMEGDVIRTIQDYHQYIAHYHTGGVPGRHEIDESQELYYPAIMKAIVETGYDGFVGQEFVPAREDKLASLAQGVQICDV